MARIQALADARVQYHGELGNAARTRAGELNMSAAERRAFVAGNYSKARQAVERIQTRAAS
jgi:hypothetical protein